MSDLLSGVDHIAVLTKDMDRFISFYKEVFDAEITMDNPNHAGNEGERMVIMRIGGQSELNVFQVPENTQADTQTPMFGRGRLDHFGLQAKSRDALETLKGRLIKAGASDGIITDFGAKLSIFFRDPDGLEAEVLWVKPQE